MTSRKYQRSRKNWVSGRLTAANHIPARVSRISSAPWTAYQLLEPWAIVLRQSQQPHLDRDGVAEPHRRLDERIEAWNVCRPDQSAVEELDHDCPTAQV